MDYQIVWTETARNDLRQLVEYIASDDPVAAARFGEAIVDHIEQTAQHPKSGRVVPEFQTESLRELILSPYRLIYEVFEKDKRVYVVKLWHAARGHPVLD